MKKFLFLATVAATVIGSAAFADVIFKTPGTDPVARIFDSSSSSIIYTKILEVTGQKPSSFNGNDTVSAKASVDCTKRAGAEDYFCQIEIKKPTKAQQ